MNQRTFFHSAEIWRAAQEAIKTQQPQNVSSQMARFLVAVDEENWGCWVSSQSWKKNTHGSQTCVYCSDREPFWTLKSSWTATVDLNEDNRSENQDLQGLVQSFSKILFNQLIVMRHATDATMPVPKLFTLLMFSQKDVIVGHRRKSDKFILNFSATFCFSENVCGNLHFAVCTVTCDVKKGSNRCPSPPPPTESTQGLPYFSPNSWKLQQSTNFSRRQ